MQAKQSEKKNVLGKWFKYRERKKQEKEEKKHIFK